MRRNHHVVLDRRVMSNVIAAPHDHVIANFNERLNRIVLEDEAIVATLKVGPGGRF